MVQKERCFQVKNQQAGIEIFSYFQQICNGKRPSGNRSAVFAAMDMGSRWEIKSYAIPLKRTKDNQRASHHCHTHRKTPKKQLLWCLHTVRQMVNNCGFGDPGSTPRMIPSHQTHWQQTMCSWLGSSRNCCPSHAPSANWGQENGAGGVGAALTRAVLIGTTHLLTPHLMAHGVNSAIQQSLDCLLRFLLCLALV